MAVRRFLAIGRALGVITVFLSLSTLGTWQLYRLQWKSQLIATLEKRSFEPALPFEKLQLPPPLEDHDFQRVVLRGHYRDSPTIFLTPRTHKGQAGQHILSPFVIPDGRIILIDRGWLPSSPIAKVHLGNPAQGEITLTGLLRCTPSYSWFTPSNDPDKNQWHRLNISEIARHFSLPLEQCYVALETADHSLPYPQPIRVYSNLTNPHLSYALTWYSLALIFLGICWLVFKRKERF